MAKIFMAESSPQDRLRLLRDNADKTEETTYEKDLTPDEVEARLAQFMDNAIQVSFLEKELASYKKSNKAKVDEVKLNSRVLQHEVKTKKREIKGTIFHIANHDEGMMESFDETGEMVGSRRLRPDEKQAKLFVAGRTAEG